MTEREIEVEHTRDIIETETIVSTSKITICDTCGKEVDGEGMAFIPLDLATLEEMESKARMYQLDYINNPVGGVIHLCSYCVESGNHRLENVGLVRDTGKDQGTLVTNSTGLLIIILLIGMAFIMLVTTL